MLHPLKCKLRLIEIDANEVFNLTSPEYMPELRQVLSDPELWWSSELEPIRKHCFLEYQKLFNQNIGHYE